jgi:thiol:disulfide interchange protein
MACWLVGRVSLAAESSDRLRTWAYAGAIVAAFAAVSFGWLYRDIMRPRFATQLAAAPAGAEGPWQPFSLERLKRLAVDEGQTVLVDFSADWCLNCKLLEQAVLHAEPVEKAIARAGVATMYADYTHYPPEIDRTIKALGANGVPVIAIFPGGTPFEPIVFPGGYTQQGLIDALQKATGRQLQPTGRSVAEAATVGSPVN